MIAGTRLSFSKRKKGRPFSQPLAGQRLRCKHRALVAGYKTSFSQK